MNKNVLPLIFTMKMHCREFLLLLQIIYHILWYIRLLARFYANLRYVI